jgi:predicted nucleic acid-binding protein
MAVKVIDASALAALLFGEPEAERVVARLRGGRLVAPALLLFEVASVCLKKIKRHPEMRGRLLEAYALRTHAGIDEVEVTLDQVIGLAEQNDLTCYDASYLWLALQLEAELVTLDEKLAGVAERLLP